MAMQRRLGERNPSTLPGAHRDSETIQQNAERTRSWRRLRRWVQSANSTGSKY